jgi:hypothetical protein
MGRECWLLKERLKKALPTSAIWMLTGREGIGLPIQLGRVCKLKMPNTLLRIMSRTTLLSLIKLLTLPNKHVQALILKLTPKQTILRAGIQP